jgi:hypothetical protein
MTRQLSENSFRYDVAISFAGEDRSIARRMAEQLTGQGYNVFYDELLRSELWGKNLQEHLARVYRDEARFCVILVSRHYVDKPWPRYEHRAAEARALVEASEYVLPIRLDDSLLPGLLETVSYLDFDELGLDTITGLLAEKLGPPQSVSTQSAMRDNLAELRAYFGDPNLSAKIIEGATALAPADFRALLSQLHDFREAILSRRIDIEVDSWTRFLNGYIVAYVSRAEKELTISTMALFTMVEVAAKRYLRLVCERLFDTVGAEAQIALCLPTRNIDKLTVGRLNDAFVALERLEGSDSLQVPSDVLECMDGFSRFRNLIAHQGQGPWRYFALEHRREVLAALYVLDWFGTAELRFQVSDSNG